MQCYKIAVQCRSKKNSFNCHN